MLIELIPDIYVNPEDITSIEPYYGSWFFMVKLRGVSNTINFVCPEVRALPKDTEKSVKVETARKALKALAERINLSTRSERI